jgi:UTP--glucose-1-phosphate uridylyltransferase
MLPVVDKPVVQYVIEELAGAGIQRVLFITGRRKRAIEDHFDADPELDRAIGGAPVPGDGLRLLYTRQAHPRGLGDALRGAEGFSGGGPLVVALGDAIIEPPPRGGPGIVSRLVCAHREHQAAATVAVTAVPESAISRYGIVIARGNDHVPAGVSDVLEVADVVEKPDPVQVASRIAIAARYVLGPEVFAALAERADAEPNATGEIGLTEALRDVIGAGGRVIAVGLAPGERRHDIGTVEGYCQAFLEHALRHPRFGGPLRARAAELLDDS